MSNKRNPLIIRVPDPFDGSAQVRLNRMGILDRNGQLDQGAMSVFAEIFAGLFFDDLCDFYENKMNMSVIYFHHSGRRLYRAPHILHQKA